MMYECHITFDPLTPEIREIMKLVVENYGFKIADLYMQKRPEDTPERSRFDTFCTAHSNDYDDIYERMNQCADKITYYGIKVRRKKIEEILFDQRF